MLAADGHRVPTLLTKIAHQLNRDLPMFAPSLFEASRHGNIAKLGFNFERRAELAPPHHHRSTPSKALNLPPPHSHIYGVGLQAMVANVLPPPDGDANTVAKIVEIFKNLPSRRNQTSVR